MAARILIVDDEPDINRLVRQRFRRQIHAGLYDFVYAENGEEALAILEKDPAIDLVITDIRMPRMDGLTLIARINERFPQLRTIVVSAYGDMANIRKAMNLGAFDFVTKPIDFVDLEATIEKLLREMITIRQAAQARELSEANRQLQELDRLKAEFFTNISHEFRTPLTVIAGMASQVENKPERWLRPGTQMIRRNADNLLQLVNQILDLRKLEADKLELHLVQGDVVRYLRYILESFYVMAEEKGIRLHFQSAYTELIMDHDPEKLLRILSNLLSNALKFTPQGGDIHLLLEPVSHDGNSTQDEHLRIRVRDSGAGIPAEHLPHIFDRFYQAPTPEGSAGTGIGLALVRELVRRLQGTIEAHSEPGRGTVFTIHLPIRRTAPLSKAEPPADKDYPPATIAETEPEVASDDRPTLLIIEDHADVRQYLRACLEESYRLSVAGDGQEGVDKARDQIPDLIVSDVMMPEMDGLEVCQTLKSDPRTSHIPIVLLTAKADLDSRIAGFRRGADAYLAKPFERTELLARLQNLLELRANLQARYRSPGDLPPGDPQELQPEDEFITQVRETVEEHLDDEYFGIPELCRAIGMSRTQLHRKLKALTGRPTSHYLRAIRLAKARELLRTTSLNISEVAFEVGFRDPKYFTRTFVQEFGEAPTEMRR